VSKTVVVTGGAGFVGAHVVRALARRGDRVIAYDPAPALPSDIVAADAGVVHLRSDVTDPGQLVEALVGHGATHVIHVAALLAEPESLQRPRAFLRVNAEAVWQLLDVGRNLPDRQRIVTASTRSVYGRYLPEEGPILEDFAPRPVAFYGAAKAAADLILTLYRQHYALDVAAARITGVYGPGQNYGHPLSEMVDAAVEETSYVRDRGGDYLYEFTYVKDVVRGLLMLLDADRLAHPIYNVGSGTQEKLSEVAAAVTRHVPGADISIGPGLPDGAAPRAALSVDRIHGDVGYSTIWSLDDGIAEFIDFRRNGAYGAEVDVESDQSRREE
jgi:nucleoside-diphosphate-sugar epimerase